MRSAARFVVLPYRRNCAVNRTLPAWQPWRSRSQLYDETRRNSYNALPDVEQLDHTLALRLLALSLTVYERDLSKLDALTVNSSLNPALMERDKPDIDTLSGRGVRVAVAVGATGVGDGATVGVGVRVGVGVLVGVGVDVLAAARMVTFWLSESNSPDLPTRYSRAVTVTLPARHAFRVGYRLVVVARLRARLSYAEQRDQVFEKPARLLFVLNETLYEWVLSKLKARTVNPSLLPAVMQRDSPDISTLGGHSSSEHP